MSTKTIAPGHAEERGAALVMVLGIMLVGAVILTTLVLVTVFNTRYTAFNREELSVLASADAGIDIVLGELEGKTYGELSTVCAPTSPYVINNDEVVIDFEYTVWRSDTQIVVDCPEYSDTVTSLTVKSTATSTGNAATGEDIVRSVIATFAPTPPEVTLSKAVFSEASLTLENATEIAESEDGAMDANVYSNGAITVYTQVGVGGQVYASFGDIFLGDHSEIWGSVWAAKKVELDGDATVHGDVYAASGATGSGSDGAVFLSGGSGQVTGSVLANGSIESEAYGPGIEGIAFSRTSTITLGDKAEVGGSVYAAGDVVTSRSVIGFDILSGGDVTSDKKTTTAEGDITAAGTVDEDNVSAGGEVLEDTTEDFPTESFVNPSGTSFAGGVGFPYLITAPQREPMPQVNMEGDYLQLWINSGWTLDPTTSCTGNDPANFINDNPNGVTGARLIMFDCASGDPVHFDGSSTHDIYLDQDTALVSATGFYQEGNISYHGSSVDPYYTLMWIVPADSKDIGGDPAADIEWVAAPYGQQAPDCSALTPPTGNIYLWQMSIENLNWFVYTPCTFDLKNGNNLTGNTIPLTGQVYAGDVNIPTSTNIEMEQIPIPSLADGNADPTDPARVRLTSRFDLRD